MRKRQSFDKAFKAEAVRLLEQSGKPAAELARDSGGRLIVISSSRPTSDISN